MNKKEKLALFLGMLSGDGCLPIQHNGEGYRDYAVRFCNTDKRLVILFDKLFFELFGENGRISYEDRENKKRLFSFCKYSKRIVNEIKSLGFPEGVKRDILNIPKIVKEGKRNEKIAFISGMLITDGCLRKEEKSILFHSGSKRLLQDMAELTNELFGCQKIVKEYIQKEIYKSYQLSLNKEETRRLLLEMPTWDNGTPLVLSFIKK